jgi:hypothetical protein
MAALSTRDRVFLELRKGRRTVGLYGLPSGLILLVLVWGALHAFWPVSVNPYVVMGRIEQRLFEPGALAMYAITATVLVNLVFALLAVCLVLAIAWARHERRYLRLIDQQARIESSNPESKAGV